MSDYNYAVFDFGREAPHFDAFRNHLHVGERAPDFPLENLDTGESIKIKDFWADGFLIAEFGSFT